MVDRSGRRRTNDKAAAQRREQEKADERAWRKAVPQGPFTGPDRNLYAYADTAIAGQGIGVSDVRAALEYLARITGDEAFETGLRALDAYGLDDTGLESAAKRLLRESGQGPHDHLGYLVEPMKDPLRKGSQRKGSLRNGARHLAIKLGIPGPNFQETVDAIRKAPLAAKRKAAKPFPDGDTGRVVRVQMTAPWLDEKQQPMTTLLGISFDELGFAEVPDNRHWRRLIGTGQMAMHGYVPQSTPVGNS